MNEEEYKIRVSEYEKRYEEVLAKLIKARDEEGVDIGWGGAWLVQLFESGLENEHTKHNKAFIWFKNMRHNKKIFHKIYDDINFIASLLFLKDPKTNINLTK